MEIIKNLKIVFESRIHGMKRGIVRVSKRGYSVTLCIVVFTALVSLVPHGLQAQDIKPEIRQITTHPDLDFSPAVSPDGQWLAFASTRSGNLDIWIKELPRGHAVQVTTHRAEDSHPAWSPDGRQLAFVSKRRDAQGDIWLVSLDMGKGGIPKGDPIQLTHHLGTDRYPAFASRGSRIVFTSDRDGMFNLWMVELDSRQITPLTVMGGYDPAATASDDWVLFTSSRSHREGDLFLIHAQHPEVLGDGRRMAYPVTWGNALDGQGAWSPDGTAIVFLRYDRDTDGDGRITPEDNGNLWQKTLVQEGPVTPERISIGRGEIQITTEIHHDTEPCWSPHGDILFTSLRRGGTDVWAIPAGGLFPRTDNALDQYMLALDVLGEATTREALFQSVLGYHRVADYFPGDSTWVARSLIQMGETYHILNEDERAEDVFYQLKNNFSSQKKEVALAEIKLAVFAKQSMESRIEQCRRIIATFPEEPSTVAEAWLILGDLYREAGQRERSLSAYSRVIQSFPRLPNFRAQAHIKIGDLLDEEGQREVARQSYLSALREFGEVPLWRKRIGERLLDQIQGSGSERIRGLQQIIQEVPDVPSLVAEAQLTIGRILTEEGQVEQALRELGRIPDLVPTLLWAHAESKIMQAKIYGSMGDELKGILLLEDVIGSFGLVEGGRYIPEAEESLFHLLFESAERLKTLRDFRLAEARYRRALQLRPEDVRVHRGLVESVFQQRQTDKAEALIREYEEKLRDNPRDPILLYGLGLAFSYYGEDRPEQLEQSNVFLKRALAEDYRLIYPYRTLSYNYEQLERLAEEEATKQHGLLHRVGRTMIAPLRWLVGLLPLGGDEKREGYYEQAIEALTTAMELNDEKLNPQMEAILAQNLANNFYKLGEFGFRNAYQTYRMRLSLDTAFAQPLEKAVFYERIGHCGLVVEDSEEADDYLLTAVQVYKELGRTQDAIRNLKRLALLYQVAGRNEEAIDVYNETLAIDEREGRWDEVERTYRNIAYNYHVMGEPEDALKYARMAERLLIRETIPMKPPKKNALRVEVLGFSIPVWGMEEIGGALAEGFTLADEVSLVYRLISRSLESIKAYPEAVVYELKRLDIFQKRKDRLAERISLNRLGTLYFKMGEYDEAWDYFYRSWEENKKKKDVRGRRINALNLGNVASVELSILRRDEQTKTAIACLEEEFGSMADPESGVTLEEKIVITGTLGTLWALKAGAGVVGSSGNEDSIQETLNRIDDLRKAESYLYQGIRLAREAGFWKEEGIFLKNLAEVAEILRGPQVAQELLEESYRVFEAGGDEELLWRVLYAMAKLSSHNLPDSASLCYEREDALSLYEQAMERLERIPVQEERSEERLSDREERWTLYADAAFEMAGRGLIQQALETVERGREKQWADLVTRRPPQLKRERHKIAWGNLRYLQSRLQEIRLEMQRLDTSPEARRRLRVLRKDRDRYTREYREILGQIKDEDAVLAYMSGVSPLALEQVRSVLSESSAALCYLMLDESTLLWAVDSDTVIMSEIGYGKSYFQKSVDDLVQRIERDSLTAELCHRMYDRLIRPVSSFIEGKTNLIIVPDGFLWELPFEALMDGEELLLEKWSVVYAPSLTSYRLAWEGRKINQDRGVLTGDPQDRVFQTSMNRAVSMQQSLLGDRATENTFREAAESADIIQIERWLMANEKDPLVSSLVFHPGDGGDGYIRGEDIFAWDLRASMVLLPSPLKGRQRGIQTPLAFVHGLLYAGVPSVIIPRWHVDREVKKAFLDVFYSHLKAYSLSDALAEAQLTIRGKYPKLRQWSAFQLVGFQGLNSDERLRFARDNLRVTLNRGWAFEQREEYSDAARLYEKARDMAEATGDSSMTAAIGKLILRVSEKGRMWGKAVAVQIAQRDYAQSRGDHQEVLSALNKLVVLYIRNGQFDKAAQSKREAVDLMEAMGLTQEVVSDFEELAFIYAMGREYTEAVAWIDSAHAFYRQREDTLGQGKALIRRGRFLLDGEEYWRAREDLRMGVTMLEHYVGAFQGDKTSKEELAAGYQLLGLASEKLALYDEALESQQKGSTLFSELGMLPKVAQGDQYMANLYWVRGDYRRALAYQKKALDGFEIQGDRKLLAMAYSTQGLITMSLGNLAGAMRFEEQALEMAEQIGSLADQATILKNMGLVAIQEGNFDRAYGSFLRASRIDSSLGFRRGLAYDYRNLGSVLIHMDDIEKGVSYLQKGLRLSRELGNRRNEVHCLYRLGRAFAVRRDWSMALAFLDSSVAAVSRLVVPEISWMVFRQRGTVLAATGRYAEAEQDYLKAVEIVEGMRAELKVEAFKQGFLDNKMDLYVDVIRLLLEMDRAGEAFDFAERAKSRNFIDLLGNQDLALAETQGELLGRERSARLAVQEAQERLASLNTGDGKTVRIQEEITAWEAELVKRRRTYEELLTLIQTENAELASLVSVDPWTSNRIQEILPDSTALVEYFLTEQEMFSWILRGDKVIAMSVEIQETAVAEMIRRFRETIQAHLSADVEGRQLYDWLVKPAEKDLRGIRHIVFVPHGILHYLPFAALLDEDGTCLIERFSISFVPSATVLGYCLEKGDPIRRREEIPNVLALSNPDLGSPLYELPFAEKEVKSLQRTYDEVTPFFGKDVTERIVLENAGAYAVIHFACHGTYEPEAPLFSALLLSPEGEDDGRLEAHEIFGLRLNCDLVTLSACETGLAQITRGDEIIGLARSFIFAGTPAIITSLWKVDDLATAVMVKRFYRYLRVGNTKAEALRRAQILVKDRVNGHPAAWAAFGLTGDFR